MSPVGAMVQLTHSPSAYRWSKGAFEEGYEGDLSLPSLSVLEDQRKALAENTLRFCSGSPASHCLVAGPSGSAKVWLGSTGFVRFGQNTTQ